MIKPLRNTLPAFLLRGFAALGHLCLLWVVSQLGGLSAMGGLVFNQALVVIAANMLSFGHPMAITRQFARAPFERNSYRLFAASTFFVLLSAGAGTLLLAWQSAPTWAFFGVDAAQRSLSMLYLPAIPLAALTLVFSGYFKGVGLSRTAILSDTGIGAMVTALGLWIDWDLSPASPTVSFSERLASCFIAAQAAIFLFNVIRFAMVWRRQNHAETSSPESLSLGAHFRISSQMMLISVTEVLRANLGLLIIGAAVSEAALAQYRVAERMATLVSFGLIVINITLPPALGKALAANDRAALQRSLSRGAAQASGLALLITAPMLIFATPIMAHFGISASSAPLTVLYILLVAQAVNMATGSTLLALKLSHHTGFVVRLGLVTTILYFALLPAALNGAGIVGAAVVAAATTILMNIAGAIYLQKKHNVTPLPFCGSAQ